MPADAEDRPAQIDGLELSEVTDGLVVFNPATEKITYLNPAAGVVLALCDGRHTVGEIAALAGAMFGLAEPPHGDVATALAQLTAAGLLRLA